MGSGRIRGDHEVAVGDDGSRFHEIPGFANLFLATNKSMGKRAIRQLLGTVAFLQREQGHVRVLDDGRKTFQGKGSAFENTNLKLGIALPVDANDRPFF